MIAKGRVLLRLGLETSEADLVGKESAYDSKTRISMVLEQLQLDKLETTSSRATCGEMSTGVTRPNLSEHEEPIDAPQSDTNCGDASNISRSSSPEHFVNMDEIAAEQSGTSGGRWEVAKRLYHMTAVPFQAESATEMSTKTNEYKSTGAKRRLFEAKTPDEGYPTPTPESVVTVDKGYPTPTPESVVKGGTTSKVAEPDEKPNAVSAFDKSSAGAQGKRWYTKGSFGLWQPWSMISWNCALKLTSCLRQ